MRHAQGIALGHHDTLHQNVLKLPHVARPVVGRQGLHDVRRDAAHALVDVPVDALKQLFDQDRDVLRALPERRHGDVDHVETVEQVFAETAVGHAGFEVGVGRGNKPGVGGQCFRTAHSRILAGFQQSQQLALHTRRQFTDLVQKQGAVPGHGNLALARRGGAREGPLLMAEHFAFQQGFHQRAAIHRDERSFGLRTCAVDGAGDEFLAGAGFAADQHRHAALRYHADGFVGLLHGAAAARQGAGRGGAVDHQFIVAPASLVRPGR